MASRQSPPAEVLASERNRREKIAKGHREFVAIADSARVAEDKETTSSRRKRKAIANEIIDEESPLAIYVTARKALEWALRDLLRDDRVPAERRRTEIAKITSALASNKPLERMREIELRLKQEDAEINRVNPGVPLSNAQQIRPTGVVSRRGRPAGQTIR